MDIRSAHFKNHPCFKSEWAGFDDTTPITLIVGRNNTGKSHLLHFVRALAESELTKIDWDLRMGGELDERSLKQAFPEGRSGGQLPNDHWQFHGKLFVGEQAVWTQESKVNQSIELARPELLQQAARNPRHIVQAPQPEGRQQTLLSIFNRKHHPLHGRTFRHLFADRDIGPEPASNKMTLSSNGSGATNIVRRFLNSSDPAFPRELIQTDMLDALNQIFDEEGRFSEITVQHHDGEDENQVADEWEIFLGQQHKGLVSLSSSGSGLKTIFLVLLNLLVLPRIENKAIASYVFAFEELENNLHPSLVRRVLEFIQAMTDPSGLVYDGYPVFFLTTHSSVALDFFAADPVAQVVHVSHDGKTGRTRTIDQSAKAYDVIWDLGTRPSDLLQANGVIWVEGPSDRIYLNRWIELYSNGRFKEGRHYQCAFYGGGLLANIQASLGDSDANHELINLLRINPNAVVISDSDRKSKHAHYKERVRRIRDEFAELDPQRAFHWILEAREIENYLIPDLLAAIDGVNMAGKSAPEQFESFFPKQGETSYLERRIRRKTFDKSKLAALTTPHMTVDNIKTRFDLDASMKRIIGLIEAWNR